MYLLITHDHTDLGCYQYQKLETLPSYESLLTELWEDTPADERDRWFTIEYRVLDLNQTPVKEVGCLKLEGAGGSGSGCLVPTRAS